MFLSLGGSAGMCGSQTGQHMLHCCSIQAAGDGDLWAVCRSADMWQQPS